MPVFDYAVQFERELQQKYSREMCSYELTQSNPGVKFLNAQTIKLPKLTVSGYKDHNRASAGFNAGTVANSWEPKTLDHDRDVEFIIDPQDIDETNLVTEIANIQNVFENEQAIPEKDSYRFSKLYSEAVRCASNGAQVDNTVLTSQNILNWFDSVTVYMDDNSVPQEGRILYCTSAFATLFKQAADIQRTIEARTGGTLDRRVNAIEDVIIKKVPSARMKTLYDFSDGCVPASGALQINAILIHPTCQVSRDKYAYMKLFTPGSDSRTADNYIYQNRYYTGTFLIDAKACGIAINVQVAANSGTDTSGGSNSGSESGSESGGSESSGTESSGTESGGSESGSESGGETTGTGGN